MDLHGGNIYGIEEEYGIEEILDYSSNINPLGVPESLKKAIIENTGNLVNYPDPYYRDLKKAIAEYNRINTDRIIPGNGATELIFLYMKTLNPSRTLIVNPTFAEYERAVRISGGNINYFRLEEEKDFLPDKDRLKGELEKNYNLLIICNPNNPTGNFIDIDSVEYILKIAEKYGTDVMIDEAFIDFVDFGTSAISLINKYKNLFILRAMTKFFAIPGLRLGYGITGNKKILEDMENKKEPWTINTFASIAGKVLLNDWQYIYRTIDWIKRERNFIYKEMSEIKSLKCYRPSANFMLLKLLNDLTAEELQKRLIQKGILIRNASNFPFLYEKFFRIGIKERDHNERLIKELKQEFIPNCHQV